MNWLKGYRLRIILFGFVAVVLLAHRGISSDFEGIPPIANAGFSRYAGPDPIVLDGTGSYDPDKSGTLSYKWQQISGPSVVINDSDTATPTISGFVQTEEIQECEFELVVSDGELTSLPDTVEVIVVADFGANKLIHINPPFVPDKPTWVFFGGVGGCRNVGSKPEWFDDYPEGWGGYAALDEKVNYIFFEQFHHSPVTIPSIGQVGDMFIVYLSSQAPDYKQPIQTEGHSAGGEPAIDIGIYLNETYADRRYAVNRVTLEDATGFCRDYGESIQRFLASAVDGEQCWIDNYVSTPLGSHPLNIYPSMKNNVLNVWLDAATGPGDFWYKHWLIEDLYGNSLVNPKLREFNHGVVAFSFWSVVGPGKNLQLASTPGVETYKFTWYGDASSGYMDFYDEPNHPGRLPEPVTLLGPEDGTVVDANGALLSCEESENAIGYQLLWGPNPYRVMDYIVISDTSEPPSIVITKFPFDQTWWTVKVYDQYGSTIYADPICINTDRPELPVRNVNSGQRYNSIQDAIDEAGANHEIVVGAADYHYRENINFRGKNLTVRSENPNNPAIVAATVINGYSQESVVIFSEGEDSNCVLAGFTITGGKRGIYCSGSSPTITNCTITGNVNADIGAGMFIKDGSSPTLVNCTFSDNSASMMGGGIQNVDSSPILINCTLIGNSAAYFGGGIYCAGGSPSLTNCILWGDTPEEISIFSGTPVINYSDIQGGFPGEGNIDTDPLFADPENGDYHLLSQAGRWDTISQSWIEDDVTSPCIDAGNPVNPVVQEPAPNGGRINMGVYGGTLEASKSP